jgi:mannose-6-phosphate isomerase-like protein (cupin superfamily)
MAEYQQTRVRQREPAQQNTYEMSMKDRREFLDRQAHGKMVVKASDRPWEQNRQGRIKFYLHPQGFKDTALRDFKLFVHDIQRHSGKHVHQGGLVLYVLEGRGYTMVDGERVDWKKGDLILLPIKPGGVEHQHYNVEPGTPCKWMALIYDPYFDRLGSELTQREESPEYQER